MVADGMLDIVLPARLEHLHFYSDSSSHRGHAYMVVGGIAVRPERLSEINTTIEGIKASAGIVGEVKWKKYKGGAKRAAYFALVDYASLLLREQQAHFHILLCHFSDFNHKISGPGNPEKSVNRMYFQLLFHRLCRFYGKSCILHVFPDSGSDSAEIVAFREVICASAYKKYRTMPNCLRSIHPQPSHKHPVIQLMDVVIGAAAAKREARVLSGHKQELADYVTSVLHPVGWHTDTPSSARQPSPCGHR
jgi:Protein of unknown function (DUF3800)